MENKSHAVAAGVFVLTLVLVLAVLAVWLTRDQGSYRTFELTTSQAVTGLQPQAAVRYKGVSVGRVVSIGFDRDEPGNVLIRITVDDHTPVAATTFASLGYQGVTGLAYIDLDDAGAPLPDLGLSPRGYRRLPLRPSNLSQLAAMGPEVIGDVRLTMSRINALLNDENQQVLIDTIQNFGAAARNTAALVETLESSWTQEIAPSLTQLSQGVGTNMKALEQTAASVDTMSREIARVASRIGAQDGVVDQLGHSMQSFGGVADEINRGTLPRLQRTLEDISATMREIRQLVRGVGDNPQALIFGPNMSQPGPGEPGHVAPSAR